MGEAEFLAQQATFTATDAKVNGVLVAKQPEKQVEALNGSNNGSAPRILYTCVADIKARPIRWLWPDRIARGKVTVIAGHPGLGKSTVTFAMAATASTGRQWPDQGPACDIGNTVILSAEDDPADTIRPRLEAAGADLSKIFVLDAVDEGSLVGSSKARRAFNLKTDLHALGAMLKEINGAALVIIDPITAYLGSTDSHKNAEIRALLSPLADIAEEYSAAVICVSHFNKAATTEVLMRVTGSLAFVAAARAAYVVAKDPENESRRLFLPLKNNLRNDATGLAFTVEPIEIPGTEKPIETSHIVWEKAPVTTTATEALHMQTPVTADGQTELDEAKAFLQGLLGEGPLRSKQIRADAEEAGHAWTTIRRAKSALGVESKKGGMKEGWEWQLKPKMPIPHGGASSANLGANEHLQEGPQHGSSQGVPSVGAPSPTKMLIFGGQGKAGANGHLHDAEVVDVD